MIIVDNFHNLNEVVHTYIDDLTFMRFSSTIGVWRIKSLKSELCKK